MLLLRLLYGLLALPISAWFPRTPIEAQVSLVPGSAPLGAWLGRALLAPWLRYDAGLYYAIVEHGYTVRENTANFHPLYPLIGALLTPLAGGSITLALLLASTLSAIALFVVVERYVTRFHHVASARQAAWLLFLTPPGFILLAPYTESTFLALVVGALFALRAERWWLAGALAALATLTRQQGLALALPLAWGLLGAIRAGRARWWAAAAAGLVPLAYGGFVLYRIAALSDTAALAEARGPLDLLHKILVSRAGIITGQRIAWPWELLIDQVRLIARSSPNYHLLIDLLLGWGLVAAALLSLRQMHILERLYVLAIVGLALCYYIGDINPYMALPRHIMLAFPLFFPLAAQLGHGPHFRLIALLLLVVNLMLAGLYFFNGWIP